MNQPIPADENVIHLRRGDSPEIVEASAGEPTVLVATIDAGITRNLSELLQQYPLKTIWAKGVDEVRAALAGESIAACLCGFWLVDGTYRDVFRLLRRHPVEIPAIIVCAPECPNEYRDYLAALNIRAFDFICHPYRRTDLERILGAAIPERGHSIRAGGAARNATSGPIGEPSLRKAG